MKKLICVTMFFVVLFLTGCSKDLKVENAKLINQNNQLKEQLAKANEKIKNETELYELRNILDIKTHDILSSLSIGDTTHLKEMSTNNISVLGSKIISKYKGRDASSEFEIPNALLNLRQRAYMLSEDKKEFISTYEVLPMKESNILKTLNIYFVLEDGQWNLNFIGMDE